VPSNVIDGESNPKILQHFAAFFQRFDHGAALKIEGKMSHLNIAFDRYASIGTVSNALHFGSKQTVYSKKSKKTGWLLNI